MAANPTAIRGPDQGCHAGTGILDSSCASIQQDSHSQRRRAGEGLHFLLHVSGPVQIRRQPYHSDQHDGGDCRRYPRKAEPAA